MTGMEDDAIRRSAYRRARIDGPPGRRAARAMQYENLDGQTAKARLEETDRARARYVDRLYGRDATDPHLYHLILDGTIMTAADAVEVIAAAAAAYWTSVPENPPVRLE